MKKTILYLMNGFGIEQKDSFNIYNSNLMPNLDRFTNEYLFGSIETNHLDLTGAYRHFSTGSNLSLTYPFLDKFSVDFSLNPNMNTLFEKIPADYPIHLFATLNNQKMVEHLTNFVSFVQSKNKNKIYLHILLDSKKTTDYKEIERLINKINYGLKELELKTISGINILRNNSKSYVQILNKGVGESWRELEKKFTTLQTANVLPENVEPFYFNNNFTFDEKSFVFFFNYEQINLTNLTNDLKTYNKIEKTYSLFPLIGVTFPLFAYPTSNVSMNDFVSKLGIRVLQASVSEDIRKINYFCNGLKDEPASEVFYTKTRSELLTDETYLKKLCSDDRFDLIIINDSIEECTSISDLTEKLKKIDVTVGYLETICDDLEVSLIISSLYGVRREYKNDNYSKFMINFSSKVPVIVKDKTFKKEGFMISSLDIFSLANTVYTNINSSHKGTVIIKRKGKMPF